MTVAELGERMSGAELAEWAEFATIRPFGDDVADLRSAIVAHAACAPHAGKDTPPLQDFLAGSMLATPDSAGGQIDEEAEALLALQAWVRGRR